jgi:hypothetical protein
MATPRRRLVRPAPADPTPDPRRLRQLHQLRAPLGRERALLARWMTRLKRAFHTVERQQQRISTIERQLRKQEGT